MYLVARSEDKLERICRGINDRCDGVPALCRRVDASSPAQVRQFAGAAHAMCTVPCSPHVADTTYHIVCRDANLAAGHLDQLRRCRHVAVSPRVVGERPEAQPRRAVHGRDVGHTRVRPRDGSSREWMYRQCAVSGSLLRVWRGDGVHRWPLGTPRPVGGDTSRPARHRRPCSGMRMVSRVLYGDCCVSVMLIRAESGRRRFSPLLNPNTSTTTPAV